MSQGEAVETKARRRWLGRGETVLVPVGIAMAGIVAIALGAAAWWSLHTQKEALRENYIEQTTAAGTLLARSIESMLASDDLTAARRLVAEAARTHHFKQCSVILPDDKIIADAETTRITAHDMPRQWPGHVTADVPDTPIHTYTTDSMMVHYPLWISGHGGATLQVAVDMPHGHEAQWQTQAGVGAIGVAAMASLLLVYRQMRGRVQTMTFIGEALVAMEQGETSDSAVTVSEKFGPHARAFNKLIQERQAMRSQLLLRQAEESLGANHRRGGDLAGVCDALRYGLLLIDTHMQVRYANGAAAVFLQVKRDQLINGDITTVLNNEDALNAIRNATSGPTRQRHVVEVQRGDHNAGLLRFNIKPMRRDENPMCLVVIEDVTQQRVAEEARNAFVAHATHELRMPLTNIRLYLETALEDGERDPKLRGECLNVINQETRRLERLVGDMLSLTEIESGSLKIERDDVRLDALFESLEADYQAQARDKQLSLTFNLPPKLPVIQGDRDKIVMALHNLLGNACKYTPNGGSVTVNVEVEGNRLVVEVKDTGFGISPEDAEKVFDKFYRAKDNRVNDVVGSGLGLALAREVVRLHGGNITLDSELNKGSIFTLTLPVASET